MMPLVLHSCEVYSDSVSFVKSIEAMLTGEKTTTLFFSLNTFMEANMVTIQVVGNGSANADVQISWRGYTHSKGRTDSSGRISWDVSTGSGTVYVNNKPVYEGEIGNQLTVRMP